MSWATVATYALRFAVWCLHNPDKVEAGVSAAESGANAAHTIIEDLKKAKAK